MIAIGVSTQTASGTVPAAERHLFVLSKSPHPPQTMPHGEDEDAPYTTCLLNALMTNDPLTPGREASAGPRQELSAASLPCHGGVVATLETGHPQTTPWRLPITGTPSASSCHWKSLATAPPQQHCRHQWPPPRTLASCCCHLLQGLWHRLVQG
jgi:hypothetical protein